MPVTLVKSPANTVPIVVSPIQLLVVTQDCEHFTRFGSHLARNFWPLAKIRGTYKLDAVADFNGERRPRSFSEAAPFLRWLHEQVSNHIEDNNIILRGPGDTITIHMPTAGHPEFDKF